MTPSFSRGCMGRGQKPHYGAAAILFVFLILTCILPTFCYSADPDVESKLKAEMLERFTVFVEWPAFSNPTFQVGIIGTNPFGSKLEGVFRETKVNGKKAEIKTYTTPQGIGSLQILFISGSEAERLPEILAAVAGKPVLTVSDTEGFAEKGVMINFYQAGEYVRFEVNQRASQFSGLKFSSRLLKLARIVDTTK